MRIHAPSERNPKLARFLEAANADTQLKARWHAAAGDRRAPRHERPLVGPPADRAQPRAAPVPAAAPARREVVDRDRLRDVADDAEVVIARRLPAARPRHVDPPRRPRGVQPVPRRRPASTTLLADVYEEPERTIVASEMMHAIIGHRKGGAAADARGRRRARGRRARHGARPLARGVRDAACRTSTRSRRRRSTRSGSCRASSARSASRSR